MRYQELKKLIKSWLRETDNYDEKIWAEIKKLRNEINEDYE